MSESPATDRSNLTLVLTTVLHAFTHAFGSMMVPLYLLMRDDLHLAGVSSASAIVTVYGLVYCLFSYPAGVLADRVNRKAMLGVGLLGNAACIVAIGLTRKYELIMLYGILAGLFGTLFHPAANALVTAHYPKSPGMAIGLLGIGSGIGFFAGPQFAGWRAQTAHWHFASVGDWQRPLVEAGIAGLIVGIVFLFAASESHHQAQRISRPLGTKLRWRMIWIALVIGLRDFAGVATLSLASIYLEVAHHLDAARTGFILGATMLSSIIVSPLAVYLSPGRRRLPVLACVLICGGVVVATTSLWPMRFVIPVLMLYMAMQLGSYALSDAAMYERVPPEVRGRIAGMFLTIAGTFSATAPFLMGWWTDALHGRAMVPAAYLPIFLTLGVMMVLAATAMPLLARLGDVCDPPVRPLAEIMPATIEPAM